MFMDLGHGLLSKKRPAASEKRQTFNEAGMRRGALWEDSAWRGDSWTISDSKSAILIARLLLFR